MNPCWVSDSPFLNVCIFVPMTNKLFWVFEVFESLHLTFPMCINNGDTKRLSKLCIYTHTHTHIYIYVFVCVDKGLIHWGLNKIPDILLISKGISFDGFFSNKIGWNKLYTLIYFFVNAASDSVHALLGNTPSHEPLLTQSHDAM